MYNKIVNPLTNRKINIHSRLGQNIIKNYIEYMNGGSGKGKGKGKGKGHGSTQTSIDHHDWDSLNPEQQELQKKFNPDLNWVDGVEKPLYFIVNKDVRGKTITPYIGKYVRVINVQVQTVNDIMLYLEVINPPVDLTGVLISNKLTIRGSKLRILTRKEKDTLRYILRGIPSLIEEKEEKEQTVDFLPIYKQALKETTLFFDPNKTGKFESSADDGTYYLGTRSEPHIHDFGEYAHIKTGRTGGQTSLGTKRTRHTHKPSDLISTLHSITESLKGFPRLEMDDYDNKSSTSVGRLMYFTMKYLDLISQSNIIRSSDQDDIESVISDAESNMDIVNKGEIDWTEDDVPMAPLDKLKYSVADYRMRTPMTYNCSSDGCLDIQVKQHTDNKKKSVW